jgi:hypothetical protein
VIERRWLVKNGSLVVRGRFVSGHVMVFLEDGVRVEQELRDGMGER